MIGGAIRVRDKSYFPTNMSYLEPQFILKITGSIIYWGMIKPWFTVGKSYIHFYEGNPVNLHSPLFEYFGRTQDAHHELFLN